MTIRERFWFCDVALKAGLEDVLGEAKVLEVDNEGDALTSLGAAPPPLLEVPPPPCDAAAEDANCEAGWDAMVALDREDRGSRPACKGEKGDDVDEAVDDLRLPTCREVDGGSEGKLDVAGERPCREPEGEGVLRCGCENAVDIGVSRVLCCLGWPQGFCWLLI